MDFRQCPACESSVLDDDAADCPFCGASMSGKPSAAPAKAAIAPAAPAEKSKAQVPAKSEPPNRQVPPRKVGETVADEDDPFGVDTSAVAQVPKVAPKPAKGRMIRITCPMCETPGFISSKMQGRDVKCCNKDCMVPVFKAPRPEKKEEDAGAKKGGISGKAIGIAAAVVVVLGGLMAWGFYFARQPSGPETDADTIVTDHDFSKNRTENSEDPQANNGGGEASTAPAGPTLAEIKRQALERIITVAQIRDDNRKAFGRRLAAEAHALAGNFGEAQEQLGHLRKVGSRLPFFQIEPLLIMAWQQAEKGDTAGAQQTIQQATQAYQELSQVGRQVVTAGISLASAQAAFGQIPQAKGTLTALRCETDRSRAAAMMHIVMALESYDVDDLLKYGSLHLAADPLAIAVAIEVASHGRWAEAMAWVNAQSDIASREDGVSALATFAARSGDATGLQQVAGVENLSATGQARQQIGLATGYLMAGNQTQAEEFLAKAIESLASVAKPAVVAEPTVKGIHDSDGRSNAGLPDSAPLQSAAVAVAQIARLQALLGQQEAAWQSLLGAWDFTAGMGPSFAAIKQLNDDLDNNRRRIEDRLRNVLSLNNRDERFRAMNQFRRQLRDFENAARERFRLELVLLREAAEWGLKSEVDAFRKAPGSVVATAKGQPYGESGEDDRLLAAIDQAEALYSEGKVVESAQALAEFQSRYHRLEQRRDQKAIQLGCRLVKQKKLDQLFPYVDALNDDLVAEDVIELATALAVVTGQGPDLWKRYSRYDLQPTVKVAFFRGLIAGAISSERRAQSQPAQTASTE